MKLNKAKIAVIIVVIAIIILVIGIVVRSNFSSNKNEEIVSEEKSYKEKNKEEEIENIKVVLENNKEVKDKKVDIIDVNSKTRPYALVVNNTDVAVKVQEGLNKAYLVYEIPTEGNTSRLLAFYKDIEEDLVIGTIRSARHNFVDFALESDAIFCCFGWSHYAEDDMKAGSIDYFQGLYGEPYYRNNPENLASEHTAYTSMKKLKKQTEKNKIRSTSDNSILLNYNTEDVDLSSVSSFKNAKNIKIPYGSAPQIASFKYDEDKKMYTRYENNTKCTDHKTKEAVTTKNIIIEKLSYEMCDDNYYWNLHTTGSGEGYYITNGYSVPITWSKSGRSSKTKYMYKSGTVIDGKDVGGQEILVSDGRTWIEVQTTSQKVTIE